MLLEAHAPNTVQALCGRDEQGDTCLHIAARAGSEPAVEALVEVLEDQDELSTAVAVRNRSGETPVDAAASDAIRRVLKPRTHYADNVR